MKCPMKLSFLAEGGKKMLHNTCCKEECAWWCNGEKECAVKVIALNSIKQVED